MNCLETDRASARRCRHSFATFVCLSVFLFFPAGEITAAGRREANTTLRLPQSGSGHAYKTENAFGSLPFIDPMVVVTPPGENNRVFVVEQGGRIIVVPDLNAPSRSLFLDISDRIAFGTPDGEGGLLGLAFHPNYAANGHFFVYYICNTTTTDGSGRHDRLSRFTRSPNDPQRAERDSEVVLFTQFDQKFNHNGGALQFGSDGYLYLTLGDEGHPDDMFNNAQRIDKDFFSAVIRIDVDNRPGNLLPNPHPALRGEANYRIPADNPYVGALSFNGQPLDPMRVRTEFWAVGLRSPWRMFWDLPTGTVYVSDVGEEAGEEINLISAGGNYGWPYLLGNAPGPKAAQAPPGFSAIPPLLTYERGNSGPYVGRAAIGGVVYRGSRMPELNNAFVFGDYYTGNIWSLRHSGNSVTEWQYLTSASQGHVVSFGIDPRNGDVLICDIIDDTVKRLVHSTSIDDAPAALSDTGAFANLATLEPHTGIVPYEVNAPFWSDGALKRRWFAIPDPNQKISYHGTKPWGFPQGTVWIKHFDLEMVKGDPSTARRVETRFVVRTDHDIYGITYRWNDAQNNAFLVGEGGDEQTFTIVDGGTVRQQTWRFPSRSECLSCHTPVAGHALGFNTAQLSRKVGGKNQIQTLAQAGYFRGNPSGGRGLVDPSNPQAPLEARVRSYLHANCASCHQPGAPGRGTWDARFNRPIGQAGIINGALSDNLGNPANRVVTPRSPENSSLLQRIATTDPRHRMPPIASRVPDEEAIALITQWINSLPARRVPLQVRVTAPKGPRATDPVITLRGTARGDNLARVVYSINDGPEQQASGATAWSADIPLEVGINRVIITAVDSSDNRSRPVKRAFKLKPPASANQRR